VASRVAACVFLRLVQLQTGGVGSGRGLNHERYCTTIDYP
jgi:hypothetical protein